MAEGLLHLARLWQVDGIQTSVYILRKACEPLQRSHRKEQYLHRTLRPNNDITTQSSMTEAWQGIELILLTESAQRQVDERDASVLHMHAASIDKAIIDIRLSEDNAVSTCRAAIAEWTRVHCEIKEEHASLRPLLFPLDLWPLVDNDVKPKVIHEWASFKQEDIPTLIADALKIDIASRTECQLLEKPVFQAQILANLRAFFEVDPEDPAMIKTKPIKIRLVNGAKPFAARTRKQCTVANAFLKVKIEEMYRTKKLQESISAWSNPVQCVPKTEEIIAFYKDFGLHAHDALWDPKNSLRVQTLYRLTGDFRGLNALSIYEVYPLPLISDLLNRMRGAERFTTSDIANAFWTVKLNPKSRELTAFSTQTGHHEYTCLPQGTKSAGNTFARIVYKTFEPLQPRTMFPYQDDINVNASNRAIVGER